VLWVPLENPIVRKRSKELRGAGAITKAARLEREKP